MSLRSDAEKIYRGALQDALPDEAVRRALSQIDFGGKSVHLVAIGKAAWQMAAAAHAALPGAVADGVVITKYEHAKGPIGELRIFEAGHPVPDRNSYAATGEVIKLVSALTERDAVLFLVSGGGSALFERPLIGEEEFEDITRQLLASGADITEMNVIRKRLSAVKGGKFAQLCAPARVYAVILSDVLGDPLDAIASGPAYPDSSTREDALRIARQYELRLSPAALACLEEETPKTLDNVESIVTGSVRQLCASADRICRELGYRPILLTDRLSCTARDAGVFLANIARSHAGDGEKLAYIAGGETVVRLTGHGLGGRNQELALAAADGIRGLEKVCVFSVGSDGTDGPTDAAGGYVDGGSARALEAEGIELAAVLQDNDSYHALEAIGGLIVTGPTGTNVNDLCCVLVGG